MVSPAEFPPGWNQSPSSVQGAMGKLSLSPGLWEFILACLTFQPLPFLPGLQACRGPSAYCGNSEGVQRVVPPPQATPNPSGKYSAAGSVLRPLTPPNPRKSGQDFCPGSLKHSWAQDFSETHVGDECYPSPPPQVKYFFLQKENHSYFLWVYSISIVLGMIFVFCRSVSF